MAKFKNTVWDSTASAYVAWLSDDDYDSAGASYPGPGTFGVDTSQYRRGEIYDAVIASANVPDGDIDNSKLADMAQATVKGRASGAGTDAPVDLTSAQATAILDEFTDALPGVVPASGGGTTNFLRADATWAAGGGGASLSDVAPVDVDPQAASAGSAGEASRQDHKHDIVTATVGAVTPGDSAAEGTAESLARSDHQHSLAAFGTGSGAFCEGDDSRLSDSRTPTSHASSHNAGGGDALAIDAAAGTGSLRTLGTASTAACAGDDSRLSDSRTPTSHNTSHQSGGGDAIKLDDLASPDDNTDLDATVSVHGLLPKLGGGTTNFLRADGTWNAPAGGGGVVLSDTAPVDVDPQAASAGSAGDASRQDHKHDIVTAVVGATAPGDSAAEGTADSLARSDHQHSLAAFGTGSGTFCEGDDSRLSDSRTPTSHASTHNAGGGDALAIDAAAGTGSLRTLGTGSTNACAGDDSRLSDSRTPTAHTLGGASHSADTLADLNALVSDATLDDSSDLRAADKLQTVDIDSALAPTDGQVLSYDGTGTQWTASSPAEGTSYLDIGKATVTDAGGDPDIEEVGRVIFDASQHNSISLRALVSSVLATTGTVNVKLYDDGTPATPGTPRLVTTFTHTDDSVDYEAFEQALTVVESGASTNEILGAERVYRAVVEITTATASDTGTVNTVGFAAVGNGDVVTISADVIQAVAMSLNA